MKNPRPPEWFIRTRDQMPLWKRIVWRTFGKRKTGEDVSEYGRVQVVGYEFRGITLVDLAFLDWDVKL